MGKKTNWTLSEDQALCRAWLCASDAALGHHATHHGAGDQKAGTFWGVVHQLFHAELETSVDRPVTGLKIRWTRINRDVQRFALAFARVQAAAPAPVADAGERDVADLELERERQAVDEATELFLKEQGSKFTFESCWRLLRFSPRWMQLLANSAGMSSSAFHAATAAAAAAASGAGSTVPSTMALLAADSTAAANATGQSVLLHGSTAAAAMALQKRRLREFLDAHNRSFPESSTAYLAAIAQELSRQSDLLEEQNAIALFRMELDLIDDDAAREYFVNLRHTYAKRMRREEPIARTTEATAEDSPHDDDADETAQPDDGVAHCDGAKETAEL